MSIKNSSWLKLDKIYDENNYIEKKDDVVNALDCGWIEQIIPFVRQFSEVGETVLDPFCGLGTTLVGAVMEKRIGIGIEIEKNRVKLATKRIKKLSSDFKIINGSASNIQCKEKSIDLVITNLPYYKFNEFNGENSNGQVYSKLNYEEYITFIKKCIFEINRVLKNNSYAVFFIENKRKENGDLIPLAWDIGKIIQEAMILKEERILVYEKEIKKLANPSLTNRSHEYALIALKKTKSYDFSKIYNFLKKIDINKCPYLIIGSAAISLLNPEILDNSPQDLDILIKNEISSIEYILGLLLKNEYKIYSWKDEVKTNEYNQKFINRYYFRAIDKTGIILDITYENDYIDFDISWKRAEIYVGLYIACREDLIKLMKSRLNKKDKLLIEYLEKL